jgi:selenocysteine-specific elongation factor
VLTDWVVQRLAADGSLETEGNYVRAAGFTPRLSSGQQAAARKILEEVTVAGVAAPSLSELPPDLAARPDLLDLVHYLVRTGDLIALAPDRFASPAAVQDAIRLVRDRLGGRDAIGLADFRDLLGVSRKYLIPLLEHFDRTRITARNGDFRTVMVPPKPLQVEPGSGR